MNAGQINKVKKGGFFGVADVVIIVIITAAALILSALSYGKEDAKTVYVREKGEVSYYSLDIDRVIKLKTLDVHIEGGFVYVSDSACEDKLCEHMGKISRAGQVIVCLPEDIVIRIDGQSDIQIETGQNL